MRRLVQGWTIGRATNWGLVAALIALLLWVSLGYRPETLVWPFAASLAACAFCGLSILWITASDVAHGPRRGRLLRAIRVFDVALGVALALPALYALFWIVPELGL